MKGEVQELRDAIKAIPLPENVMLLDSDERDVIDLYEREMSRRLFACSWKIVLCEVPTEKDQAEGTWHPEYAVIGVGYKAQPAGQQASTLEERVIREAEGLSRRIEKKRAAIQ